MHKFTTIPKVGDKITFTGSDHQGLTGGDVVTILAVDENPANTGSGLGFKIDKGDIRDALWDSSWFDAKITVASPAPPPLIGSLTNDTSKAYAKKARSRKLLTEEQNEVLLAASEGQEFDVYDFRKAATAALSAATTRAGQSMARREWAREARHLLYWADALIDNHRLALPVYVGGKRSPRIAELEAEVAKLQAEGSPEVKSALDSARRTIEEQTATIKRITSGANDEITRLLAIVNENARVLQILASEKSQAEHERDHWASVSLYVGLKFPETQAIALAYSDGLDDA